MKDLGDHASFPAGETRLQRVRMKRIDRGSEGHSNSYLLSLLLFLKLGSILDFFPAWMANLSWNPGTNIFPFVNNLAWISVTSKTVLTDRGTGIREHTVYVFKPTNHDAWEFKKRYTVNELINNYNFLCTSVYLAPGPNDCYMVRCHKCSLKKNRWFMEC